MLSICIVATSVAFISPLRPQIAGHGGAPGPPGPSEQLGFLLKNVAHFTVDMERQLQDIYGQVVQLQEGRQRGGEAAPLHPYRWENRGDRLLPGHTLKPMQYLKAPSNKKKPTSTPT